MEVSISSAGTSDPLTPKSLTVTNNSYKLKENDELYWTYTAVKKDSYFTTGQVTEETALNEGSLGLPVGTFGKFSVGTWLFQFYAYEVSETDSSDDAVATVTTDEGTTYYAKGDLYYNGASYNGEDCYTTLSTGGDNTVSVSVQLVDATGETGTVTFSGIYFVSVDDEGNETVETLGVSSLEDAGVTLSVLIDDNEVTTDTSVLDTSKVLASSSETSGESVTVTVTTGNHTVQVILYSSDETVLAESSVTVFVKPNLDTAVTGSLEVVTTDAEIGTITVSTDGTETIYTLTDDTEDTISETMISASTVYSDSSEYYYRLTDPDDGVSEYVFDLSGSTYTVSAANGDTVALEEGSTVTIKDGTLVTECDTDDASTATLYVCGATLILDNVDYESDLTGILVGDGGEVIIKNGSTVTAAGFMAISTNATRHTDEDGNTYFDTVKITIEDSTITAVCGYFDTDNDGIKDDGDCAAILVNTDATLTITNSTITAGRQAVIVRGGTATISGSTLESKAIYQDGSGYASKNWSSGDEVPYATLVVGNRNGTYYEKADVTVTDTEITMGTSSYADGIVYVAAGVGGTSGSTACETTFTYSGVTGSFGDTTYSSDSDIVGSNYYKGDSSTLTINGTSY